MEELRKQLAGLINSANLPFEAKFYVLKDVFREVSDLYNNLLKEEQKQETKEEVKDEAE